MTNLYERAALTTPYWRPGEDYLQQVIDAVKKEIQNDDFVTISEKAISTARGNILDESNVRPSRLARFLAKHWMRLGWVYFFGPMCHLRRGTIEHFRTYPVGEGSKHKQVVLGLAGFMQALLHGSEGAIDGSNLPYSYVSLPLGDAEAVAREIREQIRVRLNRKVVVVIVDTDKTYTFRNFHFTPRPRPIRGVHSFGGFLAYLAGRCLKLKRRSTPIAIAGSDIHVERVLEIAEMANRARGFGAGRNVWDMAERFGTSLSGVTWNMLNKVEHKPIVILRQRRPKKGLQTAYLSLRKERGADKEQCRPRLNR